MEHLETREPRMESQLEIFLVWIILADSCYVTTKPFGVLVETKYNLTCHNTDKLIQTALKLLSTLLISMFQALTKIHYMQDLEQNSSS